MKHELTPWLFEQKRIEAIFVFVKKFNFRLFRRENFKIFQETFPILQLLLNVWLTCYLMKTLSYQSELNYPFTVYRSRLKFLSFSLCVYSTTAVVSDKRQSYFVISIPMNLLIQNVTSPKSKEYDKFPEYCQN